MDKMTSEKIVDQISCFAAEHIASRSGLSSVVDFPHDLWEEMAQSGLFKIGIDESYGGSGGRFCDLCACAEAFVQYGCNMGIGISWLYQQLIARFLIAGFGTVHQKQELLSQMALGKLIMSFAISEPQRGAHPKLLTTTAIKDNSFYIISGEKTYLTNGPIADIFIVSAITDDIGGRKKYTSFLVPRNTAGMKAGLPLKLNFFKPAPHGGITMDNCRLPQTSILGKVGTAYPDMVIPFGMIEDGVMMGLATGAMAAMLAMLINLIGNEGIKSNENLNKKLAQSDDYICKLRKNVFTELWKLDINNIEHEVPAANDFVYPVVKFLSDAKEIIGQYNLKPGENFEYLVTDLQTMLELQKKKAAYQSRKAVK
jgi:acyl-CoA dehydrogenase